VGPTMSTPLGEWGGLPPVRAHKPVSRLSGRSQNVHPVVEGKLRSSGLAPAWLITWDRWGATSRPPVP
jgi:hypothetical protein